MRKYLKKFEQHADYQDFRGGVEYVTPNVSVCVNEDEVHYNPLVYPILKFTAEEANSTIQLNRVGTATTLANAVLQYSTDNGETWNDYTYTVQGTKGYSGDTITLENVGDSVKFKGTNTTLGVSTSNYHQFVMTGKIKATGDVTSLFNEVGYDIAMPSYGCYNLFRNCSSLTEAPTLPATTLADYCYSYMFYGCTSLTAAPELPATTLANYCYSHMFNGCTNLNYIKAMFTTTPSSSNTKNWVSNVASSGTFVKNAEATWSVTGANGIPNGWTVETATA